MRWLIAGMWINTKLPDMYNISGRRNHKRKKFRENSCNYLSRPQYEFNRIQQWLIKND